MKNAQLSEMVKGWFVGNFEPTLYSTEACEVGVKSYRAGDAEAAHYHKVATEITVVVSGKVRMLGQTWDAGSIIVIDPFEVTDFEALEDSVTAVVKLPGATHDKYFAE
jgi:hypothetical protein